MAATVRSVTAIELRKWILAQRNIAIIDVRQDDVAGGAIVNSRNIPAHRFVDSLQDIIRDTADKEAVVFHCSLSQQRGPRAAREVKVVYNKI